MSINLILDCEGKRVTDDDRTGPVGKAVVKRDAEVSLEMKNEGKTLCDVKVEWGGKMIGLHRINAGEFLILRREMKSKAPLLSPAKAGHFVELVITVFPEMKLSRSSTRSAPNRTDVLFTEDAPPHPESCMCGNPIHEPFEDPSYLWLDDGTFVKTPAVTAIDIGRVYSLRMHIYARDSPPPPPRA